MGSGAGPERGASARAAAGAGADPEEDRGPRARAPWPARLPSLAERRRSAGAGPSRRRMLVAGTGALVGVAGLAAAGGAVYEGWLPGRPRLIRTIEGCGSPGTPPAGVTTGPVTTTTFTSAARRRDVSLVVAYPPGYAPRHTTGTGASSGTAAGSPVSRADAGARGADAGARGAATGGDLAALPLCLVLHGLGSTAGDLVTGLAGPAYLAAATASGVAPFALAAVDGGETYWHRRANGDDPERMLLDEVLPRLAAQGIRVDRFGVLGWSMGGYGGLLLARRHPARVVAVAASSPAVWRSYGDAAPGAFDSAADFAANRVLGIGPARGVSYRIDCGNADPFSPVDHDLARQLGAAERGFAVGCHDFGFWRRQLPAQLAFLSDALSG
ncbi:alpha/beta hydrolase-fold protein [Pseudofrankia sp. DC12]|uniref:alpha/beta hydrolase-fold protein n=1 Tax=Pseudofrankia sp. DC12 TaxID=683315 RepID=UPI0005F7B633|nr:alpha/beta hydrolase-fold protein [Pseudofrankia sp. DC12]